MTWVNVDGLVGWRDPGVPPEVLAENVRLLARAKKAEAALDKVRALCDEADQIETPYSTLVYYASVDTKKLRAAIDGDN